MQIRPGFNPEMNELSINLQIGFLDKFYANLQGMVDMKSDQLPKNLKLVKIGKNEAEFSFPLPGNPSVNKISENVASVAVEDKDGQIRELHKLINTFVNSGIKKLYKTTEFIPLRGYPKTDIIEDIKASMKGKRNLCIIKDYSEYLESHESASRDKKFPEDISYTQYMIEYGTEEWSDVCLEILSPDFSLDKFSKRYLPLCKKTVWI